MPSPYLSKTDFKAAFECAAKLYYRRLRYPTTLDDNEYMRFLADSGFMVEAIAKAQFPHGVDLSNERVPEKAFAKTRELLLAAEDAVVFEGAFIHDRLYARGDILCREGKTLHLIEVKSSSLDPDRDDEDAFLKRNGTIASKWKPYLVDVAFQRHVLSHAFPEFEVIPWLWVVNKGMPVRDSETVGRFTIVRPPDDARARPEVRYSGSLEELRETRLLARRDVGRETSLLMPEVIQRAGELVALLDADGRMQRPKVAIHDLYKVCRKCEYRFAEGTEPEKHGFAECWGEMAEARPHILALYRVTQIGSASFDDPVPALLSRRRASLLELTEDQLGKPDGTWASRRHMQWSHSGNGGSEHLPAALVEKLRDYETTPGFPLHFVDFEACDVVLPHHAGLRPYERVAFQLSCHRLDAQKELAHAEWLNTERSFPNFKFARELRDCLGDTGTVFVWSHYEQTTLRKILEQIDAWMQADLEAALQASGFDTADELRDLADWIDHLLGPPDAEGKRHNSPRIRDLHGLAVQHYFHPVMLGRTSIKAVLPAVWRQSEALRRHPWFRCYHREDQNGRLMDPYKTLEPRPLGGDEDQGDEEAVREGTGAIRVYQELIFCEGIDDQHRKNRETLLKQYCELDTVAMIMIWGHWTGYVKAHLENFHRSTRKSEEVMMELLLICLQRIGWPGEASEWSETLNQALDRTRSWLVSNSEPFSMWMTAYQQACLGDLCQAALAGDEPETLLRALLLCDACLPFAHWHENFPLKFDRLEELTRRHPEVHAMLVAAASAIPHQKLEQNLEQWDLGNREEFGKANDERSRQITRKNLKYRTPLLREWICFCTPPETPQKS